MYRAGRLIEINITAPVTVLDVSHQDSRDSSLVVRPDELSFVE